MFAEEVGGNANRRRQEENRARRRKLKQEQQKKAQQEKWQEAGSEISLEERSTALTSPGSADVESSKSAVVSKAITEVLPDSLAPPSKELSAVEIANIQRQQRQEAQAKKKAATTMQAFFRCHYSNTKLLQNQSDLLAKRLQDLSTLQLLLKRQGGGNSSYVPPPATATALSLQILFLTKSLPYKRNRNKDPYTTRFVRLRDIARDSTLVKQFLELVLIPGVQSTNENANPLVVWEQSPEGLLRINAILRMALVVATCNSNASPSIDTAVFEACLKFVQVVAVNVDSDVAQRMMQTCRPLLVSAVPEIVEAADVTSQPASVFMSLSGEKVSDVVSPKKAKSKTLVLPYYARTGSPMDLVSILRHHLLYATGGSPIPPASDKSREACIPAKQRHQASLLFQTVFSVIMSDESFEEALVSRFVSEILTVPLLPWKVSDSCFDLLLSCTRQNRARRNQPVLVSMIERFAEANSKVMNAGDIELALCQDISLNLCNATPTQILLANMIQLGRSSVQLNASQGNKLDFEAAIVFFQFLAILVDAVPVSTFSSRESVVEWISDGKGHHSPVVLSPVILEQCRLLVSDAWARRLFNVAMDSEYLQTENILSKKTEKDMKIEKELAEVSASSAAALAAKEARTDRSKAFWKSSAWARKLSQGVGTMLSKGKREDDQVERNETSGLINATSMSRKLAAVGCNTLPSPEIASATTFISDRAQKHDFNPRLLGVLSVVYGIVLSRWGGGGGEDIVAQRKPHRKGSKGEIATTAPDPCTQNLLSVLCFSTSFVRVSWAQIQSGKCAVPTESPVPLKTLDIRPTMGNHDTTISTTTEGHATFYLFVIALAHVLILTDDAEIHDLGRPIPIHQLRRVVIALKQLLFKASCTDEGGSWSQEKTRSASRNDLNYFGLALVQASSKAMRDLYDRSSRRPICVPKLWTIDDLMEKELRRCKTKDDYVHLLGAPVLRVCPFLVSFKRRLRLFERIIYTDRVQVQGENNANPFNPNPLKPGFPVRITRGRVLEDGLATMNNLGRDMRQRIAIQYFNEAGTRETGVDAGGLFKEFWTDLSAIAFDLNFALFCINERNCMYPNPSSGAAHGPDHIRLFEFLGRILGKSLYENITIQPQFAHFFLSFLRGDYNYLQ